MKAAKVHMKTEKLTKVSKQSNQRTQSKKIRYVLHHKQFKKKIVENKELEQKEKTKINKAAPLV